MSDNFHPGFIVANNMREMTEEQCKYWSSILNAFPKLPNGLTTDEAKASPEYKTAKAEYTHAEAALKQWNAYIVKHFKKDNIAYLKAKREGKLT